jgi:hypothetical protein
MKSTDPGDKNGKKKFGAANEDDIVNWFRKYYTSDFFKKNIYDPQMSAYFEKDNPSEKTNKLGKESQRKITSVKVAYPGVGSTMTDDEGVSMGNPNLYYNQPKSEVFAHEAGHVGEQDILNQQPSMIRFMLNKNKKYSNQKQYAKDLSDQLNAPIEQYYSGPRYSSETAKRESVLDRYLLDERMRAKQSAESHDNATNEIRADIMALRYLAAKKGIWDATQGRPGLFTPAMLDKLYKEKDLNVPMTEKVGSTINTLLPSTESKKKGDVKEVEAPKNPGMMLKRLRERFNDSDLLYLMNRLAKTESNPLKSMKKEDIA